MTRLIPILALSLFVGGCASQFGLTPEQRQVLEDPQGIEKLDAEIAKLPDGPAKDKLKVIRAKIGDAKSYEEAAENTVAKYTPWGLGGLLVVAWRLFKTSRRKDDVIRQIVTGVEASDPSPELKQSLAVHMDEDAKAVVGGVRAALPKASEALPPLVTK